MLVGQFTTSNVWVQAKSVVFRLTSCRVRRVSGNHAPAAYFKDHFNKILIITRLTNDDQSTANKSQPQKCDLIISLVHDGDYGDDEDDGYDDNDDDDEDNSPVPVQNGKESLAISP